MSPDFTAPVPVSLRKRAKIATAGLFAICAVHLIDAGASVQAVRILTADAPVDPDDIDALLRLARQLQVAYWIGLVAAAVTFMVWFHRAYKNLSAFGATLSGYDPSAAVWCWFIPFVNLVRPMTIAKEIWVGSTPDSAGIRSTISSPLISWWWATWLISGFLGTILLRNTDVATIDEVLSLQYRAILVNGLRVTAAVLAMLVVKRITERQEQMIIASARVVE